MKNYLVTLVVLYLLSLALFFGLYDQDFVLYFIIPALVISSFGLVYFKYPNKKVGIITLVGLAFFYPISILGFLSIRNEMDKENRNRFMEELRNE